HTTRRLAALATPVRTIGVRSGLAASYRILCHARTHLHLKLFESGLSICAVSGNRHDTAGPIHRINGCLSHADPASLLVRLPKLYMFDTPKARFHEQRKIQRVSLVTAAPSGCGRRI